MIDKNKAVTFRIATIYPERDSKPLRLEYRNKHTGLLHWMDKGGSDYTREIMKGEESATIVLMRGENFKYQGGDEKRVYNEFSYYPIEMEGDIESERDKEDSIFNCKLHSFVKLHPDVKIKDENGNNNNPNQGSIVMFELIENSLEVQKLVAKNELITTCMMIATDLKDNKEKFVDFCYAYNIKNIEQTSVEDLYNEVILKLTINPKNFMDTFEHKQLELITLIEKAKILVVDTAENKCLINLDGNDYYMDDELIGEDLDSMIRYFDKMPKKKDYLYRKLGVEKDIDIKPVSLPPTAAALPNTDRQSATANSIHTQRIETATKKIGSLFNAQKVRLSKAKPSEKGQVEKAFEELLAQTRPEFNDVLDFWDARVLEKKGQM